MAARGALVETKDGARVVMFDGNRQVVDPQTNRLSVLYFDRHVLEIDGRKGGREDRHIEARERHLSELFNPEDEDISVEDRGKFIEKVASDSASRIEAAKVSEEWNREGRSPWGDRYARLYKKAQAQPKKAQPKKAQPKKAQAQPAQAQPAQAQPAQDRETWIQNNWANLKSGVKLRILSQSGVRPRL